MKASCSFVRCICLVHFMVPKLLLFLSLVCGSLGLPSVRLLCLVVFRLANPGAVLSLLDGPVGSDPGFHVVWCRFSLARVYSLLRAVSGGASGHGPVHLLVARCFILGLFLGP